MWKLIIDQQHQGNGYGRDAVKQVINLLHADEAAELLTSYIEGEGSPAGFDTKLGSSHGATATPKARSCCD